MAQPFVMPDGKTPTELLDFTIDLTRDLVDRPTGVTDTIASVTWVVPSGITNDHTAHDNTHVTIWLSGGTLGTTYSINAVVTTVGGREIERTFTVKIVSK